MSFAARSALVLNADFRPLSSFPLSTWNWKDAVRSVLLDKVIVVAEYDEVVRSPSCSVPLPSVIALKHYQHQVEHVTFSKLNIFLRDRFRCQYCDTKFPSTELTFDHVLPRSRGGTTCWENIVAACEPCNTRKGSGMDMVPIRRPFKPKPWQLAAAQVSHPTTELHESWLDFIYWDSELAQQ
ncbi:HNH endonuclease [Roseibium sp. Sym1]|uniref:HNH endonuclease n=1 Tax=Roseibium sp. Sym1 TaxID=3016006 RepID=UPI0022B2D423|nr:HNH endonuclease [Roseibium sp. Sym1]